MLRSPCVVVFLSMPVLGESGYRTGCCPLSCPTRKSRLRTVVVSFMPTRESQATTLVVVAFMPDLGVVRLPVLLLFCPCRLGESAYVLVVVSLHARLGEFRLRMNVSLFNADSESQANYWLNLRSRTGTGLGEIGAICGEAGRVDFFNSYQNKPALALNPIA